MSAEFDAAPVKLRSRVAEVFWAFLKLGLTSFGGPIAHLSYFRAEFVQRRRWLDEKAYADIVALCQFLPGPASSQTGIVLGFLRAGFIGGLVSWAAFTLPSALALILFAYGIAGLGDLSHLAWLHGLKIVAVAVVAQAVWGMARNLCPDRERASLAIAATLLTLAVPSAYGQIGAIIAGGIFGRLFLPAVVDVRHSPLALPARRAHAALAAAIFLALLLGLPLLASAISNHALAVFASFFRSGSLVFGGGHVVLPLLQQVVVPPGWIDNDSFLAGYGAAQAVPGPLFTFAAFLGTAMRSPPNGVFGGVFCLVAIYLPSFLLLVAALPFWDGLRQRPDVQSALKGVNAAVVGLLLGALYTPVWTSAIFSSKDFGIGLVAFLLLSYWQTPPWLVVVLGALVAAVLA
ncbi:MAG: chromate efflux transporter [Rhodoblastus sp.]|uniref:chromate efflux transporter n=1 Tax=Rhodoblastus sp. TaxID=1962975 RepID=UPI003F986C5C